MYGLAFTYIELGDIEPAQKHFQAVQEMEAPEELRSLARDGLRKIAVRRLKARGPRPDAVFYLLDAMQMVRGRLLQEIQEITFEVGMLGKYGLDIDDPPENACSAGAAGKGLLSAAAHLHHVRRLQEDRALYGYRGGSGRGVGDGGEV